MQSVLKQRKWTDEELRKAGFRYYPRKKQLVMARALPKAEAPMLIKTAHETLKAPAGYIICYDPGTKKRAKLNNFHHWPVHPDQFAASYKAWDSTNWAPNAAEQQLMDAGCKPYYKSIGVWAKQLDKPMRVQSIESTAPVEVQRGFWVAVGVAGEPWHMGDAEFRERYVIAKPWWRRWF